MIIESHNIQRDTVTMELARPKGPGTSLQAIKFRPHCKSFIEHLSQLYHLALYTAGTQEYAQRVGEHFDPQGRIFNERFLSVKTHKKQSKYKSIDQAISTFREKLPFHASAANTIIVDDD